MINTASFFLDNSTRKKRTAETLTPIRHADIPESSQATKSRFKVQSRARKRVPFVIASMDDDSVFKMAYPGSDLKGIPGYK